MSKNINQLFQEGMYNEVLEACAAQISSGAATSETYIVAAKALIHTSDYISESAKDAYKKVVTSACESILAENILTPEQVLEKIYRLKNELKCEFAPCRAAYLEKKLAELSAAPSSQGFKAYIDVRYKSFCYPSGGAGIIDAYLIMSDELLQAAHLTQEEALSKYDRCTAETCSVTAAADHNILCAERDCARNIFLSTQKFLEGHNQGTRDALASVISIVIDRFTTSFVFYEGIETSDRWGTNIEKLLNEFDTTEAYTILLEHAEVLTYMMEALVFPGSKAFSVLTGDRTYYLDKLMNVYKFVLEIDPNFEYPELPDRVGIEPPEGTESTGGCYVATAVYGSYDCPQVWTLRRFRDDTLAETWYGRAFIRTYYAISPTLVKWFGKTQWFKNLWNPALDRLVNKLNANGVENTPYNDRNW